MPIDFNDVEDFRTACQEMGLEVHEKEGGKRRDKIEWFVYVKPEANDNKKAQEERVNRRAAYHLHVSLSIAAPKPQVTSILPKSSNWRDDEKVELVDLPPEEWAAAVYGMDSQTVEATEWLAQVFLDNRF
ncbi:MAG: hypothetical protein JO063_02035 [Pseudonocardiales bacterium]|nr:hypothetical protein [Pseudonocardiales bacterium]MBW0008894.1 hypothetical protein [Pseudonocardiales bacterium]